MFLVAGAETDQAGPQITQDPPFPSRTRSCCAGPDGFQRHCRYFRASYRARCPDRNASAASRPAEVTDYSRSCPNLIGLPDADDARGF